MLKVKNWPFTFSNPAPEASPVLTLGISSKGQVRTMAARMRAMPVMIASIFASFAVVFFSVLILLAWLDPGSELR